MKRDMIKVSCPLSLSFKVDPFSYTNQHTLKPSRQIPVTGVVEGLYVIAAENGVVEPDVVDIA